MIWQIRIATKNEVMNRMNTRKEWIIAMLKIADPVLYNLSLGKLKETIPLEFHNDRKSFILLEAFGRTVCGIAPWLELEGLQGEEKLLQDKYRILVGQCMEMATNPESTDYMNFGEEGGQPLVDTAFLALALVRAPKQLFFKLESHIQSNIIKALKKSRIITPCATNWLFFSAMVETALYSIGDKEYDRVRIEYAINMFEGWYMGDGIYGDGPNFQWDYYNSFVIHPMYVDILRTFAKEGKYTELRSVEENRASRYAAILERMIAPDGTYPIIGRSVVYRFGAFQLLSQAALEKFLPINLSGGQVRCALTAVMNKVMEPKTMFDNNGWLLPGVYGNQPNLAEGYISVGSLYLCMTFFIPLGLLPTDEFWDSQEQTWTSKKVWSGEVISIDHSIH